MTKMTDQAAEHNRNAWNSFRRQRNAGLVKIRQDPVKGIRDGDYRLEPIFFELAGELTGRKLLDLGCGEGSELLAWAHKGAQVVGVDNSPVQLEAAKKFAEELGVNCRLVLADILKLPENLLDGDFDIVFSSWVTAWIGDLDRWLESVYLALKSGGIFILHGCHPLTGFAKEKAEGCSYRETYFDEGPFTETQEEPNEWNPEGDQLTTIEWSHMLGSIVTAVAQSGLRIVFLLEYSSTRDDSSDGLPAQFILKAVKDGECQ